MKGQLYVNYVYTEDDCGWGEDTYENESVDFFALPDETQVVLLNEAHRLMNPYVVLAPACDILFRFNH